MQTIILIACSKSKLDRPAPARDLYTGDLFRKSLRYAELLIARGEAHGVYVLSAEHGLVSLDKVIRPYEKTLAKLPRAIRRAWGTAVNTQLWARGHDPESSRFVFLAGEGYVAPLRSHFPACATITPMAGLGIGERLAWLKARIGELSVMEGAEEYISEEACVVCGCTDADCSQCIEKTGAPCCWIDQGLCSACATRVFWAGLTGYEHGLTRDMNPYARFREIVDAEVEPVQEETDWFRGWEYGRDRWAKQQEFVEATL